MLRTTFRGVTCKLKDGIIQIRFADAYCLLPVNPIVYKYLGRQNSLKNTGAPQANRKKFYDSMNAPAAVIPRVHGYHSSLDKSQPLINSIRFIHDFNTRNSSI